MSILIDGVERVFNGEKFYIDFENRTMKIGKDKIIERGEFDNAKELYEKTDDVLSVVERLYEIYRCSLPSERSDKKNRVYFKALSADEMTDEQLIKGIRREIAQYMLEGFILCAIINGDLVWDEETMGKWFYESTKYPDLVILRKWIENK
jgi:hypothetical protein